MEYCVPATLGWDASLLVLTGLENNAITVIHMLSK